MSIAIAARWLEQSPHALHKVLRQYKDIFVANWHLGLTAFGGPPVHFQIYHVQFVEKLKWIDEQTYQELFAISQALPGPASTKMLYSINVMRGGFGAGFLALLLWCLPGAIGMYGLSIGIAQVGTTLPPAVFALLSGLNAATVGIIALAAVQLSEKTITDKLSRLLVFFAGVAGMLYTALWYFPTLMVVAGFATFIWDYKFLQRGIGFLRRKGLLPRRRVTEPVEDAEAIPPAAVESQDATYNTGRSSHDGRTTPSIRRIGGAVSIPLSGPLNDPSSSVMEAETPSDEDQRIIPPRIQPQAISWKTGLYILAGFVLSFILVMVLRGTLSSPPLGFRLFANLYLAGTIIFGGGPVVIPLLREYVVAESWVSPRDFLLGLAIIQSFPGPNFNFAVYLGSLALSNSLAAPSAATGFLGGLIGFLAIFAPGIVIVTGFMGLWRVLRTKRWMTSFLRGVNAAAVGLVYTAVWKLWGIGYVDAANSTGSSLGINAWWVAVTACSFVGSRWFGVPAPAAIIGGGVLGLLRFAVVGA